MKTWKRNAVIAGVLVLICAGIYLNWLYGSAAPELTKSLDADKILGEATLVMNNAPMPQATPVSRQDSTDEYFAQMRLSRQTARDDAIMLLQETISYAEGEDTSETSRKLEGIIADALAESEIESLVIAKGYQDCVAYISDDGISLAVAAPSEGLTQSDVSLLADIVMGQTDLSLSDIRVIGVD
ncbi:MAG: SpoIIIAH-like family protein [Oscillospiraceae bacterium]|nr:SpoIIIAH-like family protein [Oscillospiraceae bacterium]